MSKTILTNAFSSYKAHCEANNQPIVMDEFVFAYIPNQDPSADINPNEALPDEQYIKGRFKVTQKGMLNPDAVVYSIIIGPTIGTWDFNWVGLVNSEHNLVGAITHLPTQEKVKADPFNGIEGDSLTRNIITPYTNAAKLTQINVAADVWQLDFNNRLMAMDDRVRQNSLSTFSNAAFINDGWKLLADNGALSIKPGLAYVGGLKCVNNSAIVLDVNNVVLPKKVFLVASFEGRINSEWHVNTKIIVSDHVESTYVKDDVTYYSAPLANIASIDSITDLRIPDWRTEHLNRDKDPHPQYRTLATEKNPGISQFATKGEARDKSIDDKMISPKALQTELEQLAKDVAVPDATSSEKGIVTLATKQEVDRNTPSAANNVVTVETLDKPGLRSDIKKEIIGSDDEMSLKAILQTMRKIEGKLGRVRIYMANDIDEDYLPIRGQRIFKVDYPEFFEHMGISDNTMNLPDWGEYGYIRQFNDVHAAGTQLADEIKRHNHTGSTGDAGGHTPIANSVNLGTKKGSFSEQFTIRKDKFTSSTPITLKGRSGDDRAQIVSPAWCFDAIDLGKTATHYIDVTIPAWSISKTFSSNNVSVPIGAFTPTMQPVRAHVHPVTINYTGANETRPKTTVAVYAVKVKYLTPLI